MPQNLTLPQWSQAILGLRRRLGLSQSEFGSRLHYSAMAVSRWETGKHEPASRCFIQLGNMAGQPDCSLFWSWAGLKRSDLRQMLPGSSATARMTTLRDFEIVHAGGGVRSERPKDVPKVQLVAVPLLNVSAATIGEVGGEFSNFEGVPVEEIIAAPAFWCPNPHDTYCLRVKGTSMSPLINDADVVVIDNSQTDPKELNQKIVVALHRDRGLSLARFILADGAHLLESENREYEPVAIKRDRKWQIVGKVLWLIRKAP